MTPDERYERANPIAAVPDIGGDARGAFKIFLVIVALVVVAVLAMAWHDKRAAQREHDERVGVLFCGMTGGSYEGCTS